MVSCDYWIYTKLQPLGEYLFVYWSVFFTVCKISFLYNNGHMSLTHWPLRRCGYEFECVIFICISVIDIFEHLSELVFVWMPDDLIDGDPDSKVHGPHVGPMNLAIGEVSVGTGNGLMAPSHQIHQHWASSTMPYGTTQMPCWVNRHFMLRAVSIHSQWPCITSQSTFHPTLSLK